MLKIETTKQIVIAIGIGVILIILGVILFTKMDIERGGLET